jgi:hypothetical protein
MYWAVPNLGGSWHNRRLISLALLSYLTVNIICKHPVAIRNNDGNSGYSNHIPNTGHTYGTITDTMDVIRTGRKGRHLNTLERYHIYKISRNKLHMNDTHVEAQNLFKKYTSFTVDSSTSDA